MPRNRQEIGAAPTYITCDPLARAFPREWKDIWFRRQAKPDQHGMMHYTCPICQRGFDHRSIHYLQGDHVWPYSLFGETSWANYQLVCGSCNAAKSNRLDGDVRAVLGRGEFRSSVIEFLRSRVADGALPLDPVLKSMLGELEEDHG